MFKLEIRAYYRRLKYRLFIFIFDVPQEYRLFFLEQFNPSSKKGGAHV